MAVELPLVASVRSSEPDGRFTAIVYTFNLTYAGFAWSAQATYSELAAM